MRSGCKLRDIRLWLHENYHWVVVVVMFSMLFTNGGSLNNLSSLHIGAVTEALGISRSDYSLAMIGKTAVGMLSTFFSGVIIARFGARLTATVGMMLSAAAFILLSNVQAVWMLVLAGCLLGSSLGFCSTSAAAYVSRAWFHHYGGTVLGIITAATGIGGSALCMIQTPVMEAFSFRASYLVSVIAILFSAVLVALFVRNDPKEKGLSPIGEGEETVGRRRKSIEVSHPGLPMKTLWTRPAFWLMVLCTFLMGFGVYTAYIAIPSHLSGRGLDKGLVSALWSGMLLALTLTKILGGVLCDRFGSRRTNIYGTIIAGMSLLVMMAVNNPLVAAVAVVLYAAALPMVTVVPPLVAFSLFGYRAMGGYTGIFLALITVGSFLAEYAAGMIFDIFGSYQYAFLLGAICCGVSLLLNPILYYIADKDLARPDAPET